MKRPIIMSFLLFAVFLVCVGCSWQGQTSSPLVKVTHPSDVPTHNAGSPIPMATSTPTATSTPIGTQTPTLARNISSTITEYYQAVEHKNYVNAYSYLSSDAITASGQKITLDAFLQMAQVSDVDGAVSSFAFIADSTNPTQIIVTLTRSVSLRYHAHLQLKEWNSVWQIFQLDRI